MTELVVGTTTDSQTYFISDMIGTEFEKIGYTYIEDDNSHEPYTYKVNAWATPVALRCELP